MALFTRRWDFSMFSIGRNPKPQVAPCLITLLAMCVAMLRSLAMLRIKPFLPSISPMRSPWKNEGVSLVGSGGGGEKRGEAGGGMVATVRCEDEQPPP